MSGIDWQSSVAWKERSMVGGRHDEVCEFVINIDEQGRICSCPHDYVTLMDLQERSLTGNDLYSLLYPKVKVRYHRHPGHGNTYDLGRDPLALASHKRHHHLSASL
jgi:hypothetical protein